MKKVKKHIISKILIFAALSTLAISFLYPLLFMFINSFKSKVEYRKNAFSLPTSWSFDNYIFMLDQFQLVRYFFNTIFIAAVSISIMMALAIFASYAFARLPFKGRSIVYLIVIGTMFIPAQVTMIPMYQMFSKIHLVNSFTGVILCNIAGGIPGAVLLLTSNFKGIPGELIEASKIDGAGYFKVVRHVIIPLGKSTIAINVILAFVSQCNDLFTPMILLQEMDKRTVMVALSSIMTKTSGDQAFQLTGLLLAVIPPLLIYLCLQKYLVKGLTLVC
ncbi:carbohydrate ABC transporter permease [Hungatella hathewayi]|uniref:carbohydrate ABC transporter permease n=1 Tax=Hungatella hathewayi TaxID=154046 RepID=UPI0011DD5234|nr:carbohydrate ABC transporter permease [Hungatella hathewayi]